LARSGITISYGELDDRSLRFAGYLRQAGLGRGDHVAYLLPNSPEAFEVAWAAQRSGLYYTPIGTRLTVSEIAYLVNDCDALAFVSHPNVPSELAELTPNVRIRLVIGEAATNGQSYASAVESAPRLNPEDEAEGARMHYTSGTTGRPKGVQFSLLDRPMGAASAQAEELARVYSIDSSSVYLSPGPLYHAAPLGYSMACHRIGATVVVLDRFDPVEFLEAIESYRVTHVQCVPTMFVRLLALDERTKKRFDLRSLQRVIHAAAPCPVVVKERMIEWLGPIVDEYYGGSEHFGATRITAAEWLVHRGSVGREPLGRVHILDPDGAELGPGEVGGIYFENDGLQFSYYKDPEKTARARDRHGWYTYGDIGHLDVDGYLYLTDRRDFVIISGGVNIYPQEIEDVLVSHPDVLDAGVFGLPHPDFGEQVVAVVQLRHHGTDSSAERADLEQYCRERLAGYKVPRVFVFDPELPRSENGKLYKKVLRDRYVEASQGGDWP
jgi:acyl-CoA synthetase (AMP-forming)/AMP-acid ligase II